MLFVVDLVLSAAVAVLSSVFGNLVSAPIDFWKPLLIFVGTFVGIFALCLLFAFVLTRFVDKEKEVKKPSKFYHKLFDFLNAFILTVSNVRVKFIGKEKLEKGRTYLFVCNHRSNYDNMILAHLLKKYDLLMISKPENFDIPMVGELIHKMGYMSINRENDREALKTILLASKKMNEGYSVCVCPEGTRNKNGIDLLPFKNGVFKIAYKSKSPIAVICLNGTQNIHKFRPFVFRKVFVEVTDVIEYEDFSSLHTNELGEIVRNQMLDIIEKRNGVEFDREEPRAAA